MPKITDHGPYQGDGVDHRPFWSLHTHSRYSVNDALADVYEMVDRAVALGYPALGLTDHGSVAGLVQHYRACRKAGIEPLPGIELYVTADSEDGDRRNYHLTVAAYSQAGYRNLVNLTTLANKKFYYRPRVDLADLANMAEEGATNGLLVASGCHFGLLPSVLREHGEQAAYQLLNALAGWFPRVYVEIQHHGIHTEDQDDDQTAEQLYRLANHGGFPVILTQDSHYTLAAERALHDGLKRLCSWSDDVDDAIFPGETGYHMVDANHFTRLLNPSVLGECLDSLTELANVARVRIDEFETFTLKVPELPYKDPHYQLQTATCEMLACLNVSKRDDYGKRLNEELEVVRKSGMAAYLLVVDEVCRWMREQGIFYITRGSASGSLILYLLGITHVDPVVWGIRFDRFLSEDRTRPPDVDLDVEHTRRGEVIEEVSKRWPTRQVGSLMTYALFDEDEDVGRGSLRTRYYAVRKKAGLPDIDWRDIPPEDKAQLVELARRELISGYGKNAAGFMVAPDEAQLAKVPLTYIASSESLVTAYGKKDIEPAGWLKIDLLGVRTLTAIRLVENLTGQRFDQIPNDDKLTMRKIAAGNTTGMFQLEGHTQAQMVKRLRPKHTSDIVLLQALARPAVMDAGATDAYFERLHGQAAVPDYHDDIELETKDTLRLPLYQEQLVAVLRRIGLTAAELTDMLDAIKASGKRNQAEAKRTIESMLPKIKGYAGGRGWTDKDIAWLSDALLASSQYSFNLGHSASYGVTAYRTGFYKTHHTLAFWAGMLEAFADHDKAAGYLTAARRDGVRIIGPHVNHSKVSYTIDHEKKAIRKGLVSIKRVGKVAAAELVANAPYRDTLDLASRVLPKKVTGAKALALGTPPLECGGVIAALADAGALDGLD